jgi:tetratricopeptide (TPR) repeat protein
MRSFRPIALVVAALLACSTVQAQQNYMALSYERYRAGHYQESIEAAEAFLKINPKSADAYNNIAVGYLGLKKFDEAIASAEQALRLQPDHALAAGNLNWIRQEKAKARGLPLSSVRTPESYLEQSLQDFQHGQFQECIADSTEALRLRPGYAEAYNNVSACSTRLLRWDDAIRSAQEAVRLKPDFQLAKNNLAWAQQQKLAQDEKRK